MVTVTGKVHGMTPGIAALPAFMKVTSKNLV